MEQDEEYFIPAEDQRLFGAGIKRKRVQFVPAATVKNSQAEPPATSTCNAGDRYLSIVLPSERGKQSEPTRTTEATSQTATTEDPICNICNLPLISVSSTSLLASKPHETSLVHQVCLVQSHPPSHLDRTRTGLKYLSSYGWDPDSRLGLGAKGEGIRAPIKGKIKNDTVGLGVKQGQKKRQMIEKKEVLKLDAKGLRKKEVEEKKRREKLQELFYGSGDLEKYLGSSR